MRILLFLLFVSFQSCAGCQNRLHKLTLVKENVQESKGLTISSDSIDNVAAIRMLEEFYTLYLTEQLTGDLTIESVQRSEQILKKYVTYELLNRINQDETVDYDPFVNAQDYFEDWLNTIKVTVTDSKAHIFTVTLERHDVLKPTDAMQKMIFLVIKKEGCYMIGDILDNGRVSD